MYNAMPGPDFVNTDCDKQPIIDITRDEEA